MQIFEKRNAYTTLLIVLALILGACQTSVTPPESESGNLPADADTVVATENSKSNETAQTTAAAITGALDARTESAEEESYLYGSITGNAEYAYFIHNYDTVYRVANEAGSPFEAIYQTQNYIYYIALSGRWIYLIENAPRSEDRTRLLRIDTKNLLVKEVRVLTDYAYFRGVDDEFVYIMEKDYLCRLNHAGEEARIPHDLIKDKADSLHEVYRDMIYYVKDADDDEEKERYYWKGLYRKSFSALLSDAKSVREELVDEAYMSTDNPGDGWLFTTLIRQNNFYFPVTEAYSEAKSLTLKRVDLDSFEYSFTYLRAYWNTPYDIYGNNIYYFDDGAFYRAALGEKNPETQLLYEMPPEEYVHSFDIVGSWLYIIRYADGGVTRIRLYDDFAVESFSPDE
jgi:hypothetical protein